MIRRSLRQGNTDDFVYFLLFGEVDIVINGRKASIRESPNQVGEMAALDPGKRRTATVTARVDVVALKVQGVDFRKVWGANIEFQQRLQVELLARHRERIAVTKVNNETFSPVWTLVSLGLGLAVAIAVWIVLWSVGWNLTSRSLAAIMLGLIVFVVTSLYNPAFFWRRSFGLVLVIVLADYVTSKYVSFDYRNP